ncbi:MAG: hypothetical protein F6K65_06450 [Moorea sp. SIO3C2]|nr:hypothetical protein [Moorena sp. SIO3C2]NES80788.1 hypothetical protein [Moorena sp. SIO2B7]
MKIPLLNSKKHSIVAIGNENSGYIYLKKLGYPTVGECEKIDPHEYQQLQGQVIIHDLARKIAEDRNISREEAMGLIFPSQQSSDIEVLGEENILFEYPQEMESLAKLKIPANQLKAIVATVMIQNRVVYPVRVKRSIDINGTGILVEELGFYVQDGDLIKFGDCIAESVRNHDIGETVLTVAPLSKPIQSNCIGFLYNLQTKQEETGSQDWTLEDTSSLDQELVEAIYDFYQREKAKEQEPGNEGKLPAGQENGQIKTTNPLIGEMSTGEFNPIESQIPDFQAGNNSYVNQPG